tara:strand:+ start:179 stop:862 length:684 start_codon:yes stop_codon:yes gene_type:complete
MLQSIDKKKIYFYFFLLLILLSIHNQNFINSVNNFFKIKKIIISKNIDESLNNRINKELSKFYNFNIFFINTQELKDILDNFNIISEYNVKKEYPSALKIDLKKTDIVAYYFNNNHKVFVGENGKEIKDITIKNKNIPIIEGKINIEKLLSLNNLLKSNDLVLYDFIKFYLHKSNRWDLIYKKNITIKLPVDDLEFAIDLLKNIINSDKINNIKIIDLRIKNNIVLS